MAVGLNSFDIFASHPSFIPILGVRFLSCFLFFSGEKVRCSHSGGGPKRLDRTRALLLMSISGSFYPCLGVEFLWKTDSGLFKDAFVDWFWVTTKYCVRLVAVDYTWSSLYWVDKAQEPSLFNYWLEKYYFIFCNFFLSCSSAKHTLRLHPLSQGIFAHEKNLFAFTILELGILTQLVLAGAIVLPGYLHSFQSTRGVYCFVLYSRYWGPGIRVVTFTEFNRERAKRHESTIELRKIADVPPRPVLPQTTQAKLDPRPLP